MKILIDAFGGDNAPEEIIIGALDSLKEKDGFGVELVGDEEKINKVLSGIEYDKERVSVLDAKEVITCEEEPTLAIRRKPDSSISVAFKKLKEDEDCKAFVSAGSTGAVLVGATLKLGRIKGVNRPALCPIIPTAKGEKKVLLLDSGANADCKAINLCQFAIMGSVFSKICLKIDNPKVALLSNGTEDEKGNMLNHEVFPILKNMKGINFVGNCEARDILSGKYDVIVADGFSGNVAIKSIEGAVTVTFDIMKEYIYQSKKAKFGALFLKGVFKKMKKKMDYNNAGGAIFVGVDKIVVKSHGSSNRQAFKNAVLQAVNYAETDVISKLKEEISSVDLDVKVEQ